MTTPEANTEVMERLVASFNERDRTRFDSCYGKEVVVHSSSGAARVMDHDMHWREVVNTLGVFPDLTAQIDSMVAKNDRIFLRGAYTGTHTGKGEGSQIEPTGEQATWAWWCEYRFEGGRIVEAWNIYDTVSQLRQLGLWNPPGADEPDVTD